MRSEEPRFTVDIAPIIITYEGLDADSHSLDMALLAQSIEGFGRIISTVASYALTAQYHRQLDIMPVRAKVQEFSPGSLSIKVALDYLRQGKLVPDVGDLIKATMKWIMARMAGKKDTDHMKEALSQLLLQNGTLIQNNHECNMRTHDLLDRMADGLLPSARKAVAPVGESCREARLALGQEAITVWNEDDKARIEDKIVPSIQPSQYFNVYVTEIDIATGAAKVSFGIDDQRRIKAKISDPVVFDPGNPYAMALAQQSPLAVLAKSEFVDGEIVMLHISDYKLNA